MVVVVGLFIRRYLSTLNLLLVARIATLVIVVVAIMSIVSVLSYRLGLEAGLTITFFPMIILAWTIERMSILWEEDGPKEVLIQGSGSLFVAVTAFLVMDQPLTRHLAFNFPELHLVRAGGDPVARPLHRLSAARTAPLLYDDGERLNRVGESDHVVAQGHSRNELPQRRVHRPLQPARTLPARRRQAADEDGRSQSRRHGAGTAAGDPDAARDRAHRARFSRTSLNS